MQRLNRGWQFLRGLAKRVGPYVLVELLLPGGTLFAVLLYLYRSGALAAFQPMPVMCAPYAQVQTVTARPAVSSTTGFAAGAGQRAIGEVPTVAGS